MEEVKRVTRKKKAEAEEVKAKPKPRRKYKDEEESYDEQIYRAISRHIDNNSEFYIVAEFKGGLLVAKTIRVTVKKSNNNSTFMPFDTEEQKKYCTITIVEYSESAVRTPFIRELGRTGCPVIEIGAPMQVKAALNDI